MKSSAAILVLLALAGCTTNPRTSEVKSAPAPLIPWTENRADFKPALTIVRSVHGEVESWNGSTWQPLRQNMELTNGTQIRTGHRSEAFLRVNGIASTIKLIEDTQLDLTAMMAGPWVSTRTVLDVRKGTILGSVRKLSAESAYQVRGAGVTLKIHGTDFQMSAEGRVDMIIGVATVTSDGKDYQVAGGEYFDPGKSEIGKLPTSSSTSARKILYRSLYPPPPPPEPHYSWPQPESPLLSPFDRGLENARHGGYLFY